MLEAYQEMLPKETQECQYLKEELDYFTNQSYEEIRRITMMNYHHMRDQLVNFGEQQSRFIYEMNFTQTSFLQYFSCLNNERKTNEADYELKEAIGEEMEPEEIIQEDFK